MNQHMTALLLICATLMGQGQPAQLNVRLTDTRGRQELNQSSSVEPLLRAQLGLLAVVELQALFAQHAVGMQPGRQELPGVQTRINSIDPEFNGPVTLLALSCPSARAP